jgi:hypothetical protein
VECGSSRSFAITPAAGNTIVDVAVDGQSVGAVASYTFADVRSSHEIAASFSDAAAPTVRVLFPNGGETLVVGTAANVTWSATDNSGPIDAVDLRLSRDRGATWEDLRTGAPNTGTYSWTVTGPGTNIGVANVYNVLFRVEASDGSGNLGYDVSDAPFSCFDFLVGAVVTQLGAEPLGGGLRIRWQLDQASLFTRLALERAEQESGPWAEVTASRSQEGRLTVVFDSAVRPGRSYWYRLVGVTNGGSQAVFGPVVAEVLEPVEVFALGRVLPNPTTGPFSVDFAVAQETHVHLGLHDVQGREVAPLADGEYRPGRYRVQWDGSSERGPVAMGVYFLRYSAAGKSCMQRIVIAR